MICLTVLRNVCGWSLVCTLADCDAGWLLTAQGYFDTWPKMPPNHTGSGGSVHSILDSVTAQLAANPSYRFVWAETIWLEKWWPLQNASTRATFQQLVDEQRIEFVGGGYVQNDETMVTHQDVVDQTTVGHEFLRREFNATVHHGWQIDMFSGYSSVTPSLWALSGYEAMLLRYEGNATMRATWEADKAFEFVWQASNSLTAAESSIFAHVVNGNYGGEFQVAGCLRRLVSAVLCACVAYHGAAADAHQAQSSHTRPPRPTWATCTDASLSRARTRHTRTTMNNRTP